MEGVISYFTENQLKRNADKINVFFHLGSTSFETIYSKRWFLTAMHELAGTLKFVIVQKILKNPQNYVKYS